MVSIQLIPQEEIEHTENLIIEEVTLEKQESLDIDNLVVEELLIVEELVVEEILPPADSLLSSSNVTVEELESSLYYELIPLASCFLEAEELYGVNACYLASIAGLESGWGRYQFKENNLFGFGSKSFESPEECIYYVAEFLATEYLSEDGRYYGGGTTLYHVNKYYNGRQEWYDGVSGVYAGIMRRIEEYRG